MHKGLKNHVKFCRHSSPALFSAKRLDLAPLVRPENGDDYCRFYGNELKNYETLNIKYSVSIFVFVFAEKTLITNLVTICRKYVEIYVEPLFVRP